MYSKDVLTGIFLAKAKGHISITRNKQILIGYRTKLSINIRGSANFVLAVKRSLAQYNIFAKVRLRQSENRPTPILTITGIRQIALVITNFLVDLPDANDNFASTIRRIRRII